MMEQTYVNCKYWIYSCPQRGNEYMAKTEPREPPVQHLGSHDIDEINKLCAACPKFEIND